MKNIKTIKALCVMKKDKLKLSPFDIYDLKDDDAVTINDDEIMCEVEIKFIKYHE